MKQSLPERLQAVLTVFEFNLIFAGVLWMLVTGLSEHAGIGAR